VILRGRRGRDRMVVGFTTTYAIGAYHHWMLWVRIPLRRGALDTKLCDNVCLSFSPVSSTNKLLEKC